MAVAGFSQGLPWFGLWLVVVEAVRKVEIAKRFPRAFLARLFHSFSPADSCFSFRALLLAHGFAAHLDAVCVVHQTIEDAVRQRGISDLFMPTGHRQL